ncbi:MAG: ATP synthase F0 subunit B [Planctomycetes bacterium]|nr:ATP synthase F0 subunit B [Planctomycetota bacterium]
MEQLLSSFTAQFFWGLSAFIVFVLVLYRLGVTKILEAVDARDARIKKDLADAEEAAAKAKSMQAELEKKIRASEEQVTVTATRLRVEAEQAKDALIEKGRAEVEAMRVRALQDIEAARHSAIVHLRQEVADIATDVAAKVITAKLDDARQGDLVKNAIEAYEASGKR